MVLEDLFWLLHFFTRPPPVHPYISIRPQWLLPVQMTGLCIKLWFRDMSSCVFREQHKAAVLLYDNWFTAVIRGILTDVRQFVMLFTVTKMLTWDCSMCPSTWRTLHSSTRLSPSFCATPLGLPLAKTFKFSIEYSVGFLLIVFYRIFANSFLKKNL